MRLPTVTALTMGFGQLLLGCSGTDAANSTSNTGGSSATANSSGGATYLTSSPTGAGGMGAGGLGAGGMGAGGLGAGGNPASSVGGSSTATTAGSTSSGGATSVGGATGSSGTSPLTAGCGKSTWPVTNDQTGGAPYTLDVSGTTREFYVSVPATYDPAQPTRVVFGWHWRGGNARNVISGTFGGAYYGLKSRMSNVIYVAAEGLVDNGTTGWANTGGRDIAFLRALLDYLDANYCVDKSRIFSVGFSYGGMMSDNIACQLGDTFRAVAPIAGALFGGTRGCVNERVAAHVTHGSADDTVDIASGIAARDYFIATNHCTTVTQAIEPSPCVEYTGCDAGYPVVWCEHTGGHTVPSFASAAIATFFQRF